MSLNQTKFSSGTEKVAHNMSLLAILPFGLFSIWQLSMILMGATSAASWFAVVFWAIIAAGYGLSSRLLLKRRRKSWFLVAGFLVLLPIFFSVSILSPFSEGGMVGLLCLGGINLYLLILLLIDRRNYFAAIGKADNKTNG